VLVAVSEVERPRPHYGRATTSWRPAEISKKCGTFIPALRRRTSHLCNWTWPTSTLNSAIPVTWSTWLSKGIRDEPESGGGLMVGTVQLAIMLGAGFGGLLLDHLSIAATFIGSAVLLMIASVAVGGAHPPRD
jgi:predicted MFS family arabinose efflux permease